MATMSGLMVENSKVGGMITSSMEQVSIKVMMESHPSMAFGRWVKGLSGSQILK